MKLNIIQKRNTFFFISGVLVITSLLSWIAWGLKPGIDFNGGSLLEAQFKERPSQEKLQESLKGFNLGEINIQPSGENKAIFRFKEIDEDTHQKIINKLKQDFGNKEIESNKDAEKEDKKPVITAIDDKGNPIQGAEITAVGSDGKKIDITKSDTPIESGVSELGFNSIGSAVGKELRTKSFKAIIYVNIAIILYIAWSFKKVSKPIASWKYGIAAVVALVHDITITIGVFVFLGHYFGIEVNTPFIAALLTILGYSVNDTIVVFDRIREKLHRYHENFEETVNNSVNETIVRSLNTSLTVIFTLLAVYFFGGESIKYFALALIIGVTSGTYSSIFIASALLVTYHKVTEKLR